MTNIAVWLWCSNCIIESGQIIKLYLDVGLTRSTHKVTIDTVEDMHRGRHLIKTHLNPKIRKEKLFSDHRTLRRKTFRSPDIQRENFQITGHSGALLILAPWPICIFLIDCFKVDISACSCSMVPGINARTALWLPSLDIKF